MDVSTKHTYLSILECDFTDQWNTFINNPGEGAEGGKSFGGYTNLVGDIVSVTVTKVCKKLGIAIDGGANTKQKAVIIREISVSHCVV